MSGDFTELPNNLQEQIILQIEDETGEEFDEANYKHYVRAQELCDEGIGEYRYDLGDMER